MKKLLCLAAGLMLLTTVVYAANPDSLEVSCTPTVTYSVSIATPTAGLDLGNVNLNTTYVAAATATVTNNGLASADWKIKGIALSNWTLGSAPGSNQVRLLGALKTGGQFVSGDFDTANDALSGTEQNMDATKFTVNQTGNDVSASGSRILGIRLDTPTDTTYDTQQKFRIEIKAYVSSTF